MNDTAAQFKYNNKVLYVDDEQSILTAFQSMMRREKLQTFVLNNPEGIDTMLSDNGPFAVVMSDQRMPRVDGVEVLNRVAQSSPDTVRLMVTGYADYNGVLGAINRGGISHYIKKPWDEQELSRILQNSIVRYNLIAENKYLVRELKEKSERLSEALDGTVAGTAQILSDMLAYVNPHASSQVERVRRLGLAVLKLIMGLSDQERWEVSRALDLFNLGFTALPAKVQFILNTEGLNAIERFPSSKNHNQLAAALLKDVPQFDEVARIIRLQNKNFDGSGEPAEDLLAGKELPLGSRLIHILTDLDAQTTPSMKGKELLLRMAEQPDRYDCELIHLMLGDVTPTRDVGPRRFVSVDELEPGMLVLDDIITVTGQSLIRSGVSLTETSVKILREWHMNDPIKDHIHVLTMD
jgi:response regulator RpfG family c-di-GMP phosphodiesterase